MKQKDFLINLIFLISLNLFIKPFWIFGIDIGVQNSVGTEVYGLYFAVFNFSFLFNIVLDMGITSFNNRNIAQYDHLLQKHFSRILILKLMLGIVYLFLTFLVAFFIGYDSLHFKILLGTAIIQFLNSLILYLRSNVSALLMFKTDSFLSILDKILMIFICSILLWGNVIKQPFKIEWFICSQIVSSSITVIVILLIINSKATIKRPKWNLKFSMVILKKSFPFALLYLLMAFYCRMDSVMLERLLPNNTGAFETGVYASAFRVLDALVMIAYLFSVILLPLFSKMLKKKDDITGIVKTAFSFIYYFSITITILLITYRYSIVKMLYKQHITESVRVFEVLIPSIIPISFIYIFGTILTANGNIKWLNISSIVSVLINILLNLILIPKLHAMGAAITGLVTQSFMAFVQIVLVTKKLKISISYFPYFKYLIYTLSFLLITIFFNKYVNMPSFLSLVILLVFSLIFAIITGIIPLKEINIFSKQK